MPTRTYDQLDETGRVDFIKQWMTRIDDAMEREKKFRQKAQKVVEIYEGDKSDETPFAIIYSNTETLQPALYNARPIPIVTRRFEDADPVGKAASEVGTRTLKFLVDTDSKDYDNYDELIQAANLDALLTNRGVTRFKYAAHSSAAYPECVYGEAVRWDKFFHGYARTWKKVPWIGFEWDMTADEIKKNFPGVAPLNFQAYSPADESHTGNRDEYQGVTLYKVYEIWDKVTAKVYFLSAVSEKNALRVVDDPLGLSGFFPVARPLNFMKKTSTLIPTPLYEQYRRQAQELNELTLRLKDIIKCIKWRGLYNGAVEDLDKALKSDDNEFIPVQNLQSMPEGTRSIDDLIWTLPIDELVQTAQSLSQQRESCKQVIYEITGISDILRGASIASETATAQNIKNQWGTLRLRKMQKEVQRYCRETLAIMLEIAANKFEVTTFAQMTGLPYLYQAKKQEYAAMAQQFQQRNAAIQQAGGQPQPPPPIPPQIIAGMQLPSWEQIMQLLHNDVARAYRCDIETNSTIDAEASQDKQDISELLNALGQFFNAVGPLVQEGTMPFEIAKQMLLVITRRYNFGSQLEDMLSQMTPPQQQGQNSGEQAAAAAKAQQTQAEAQLATTKAQNEMQITNAEHQNKMQQMAAEAQLNQAKMGVQQQELKLQAAALSFKLMQQQQQHNNKMQQLGMNIQDGNAKTALTVAQTEKVKLETEALQKTIDSGGPAQTNANVSE